MLQQQFRLGCMYSKFELANRMQKGPFMWVYWHNWSSWSEVLTPVK